MQNPFVLILSCVYLIIGIVLLYRELRYIYLCSEIQLISFTRIMYSFVYGLLPAIILFREYNGNNTIIKIDTSGSGLGNLVIMMILSIIGYFLLCAGYSSKARIVLSVGNKRDNNLREVQFTASKATCTVTVIILIVLGWLSLYLWTKAYGSMNVFIQNAARIRSGYGIQNNLAFFKEFARVIIFGLYGAFILLIKEDNRLFRFLYLCLTIVAGIGCYVFIMSSDSRTMVAVILIGLALILLDNNVKKHGKQMFSQLIIFALILFIGFFLISIAEPLFRSIREGYHYTYGGFDLFGSLEKEFRYILQTQQTVVEHVFAGDLHLKLIDDVYNALFSWFPSRFKPANMPETLWAYNTRLQLDSARSGTWPTDLISAGIYHLNFFGALLLPLFYGRILKEMERFSQLKNYGTIENAIYYGLLSIFIINVSHFEYSNIVQRLFPLFLTLCVYRVISRMFGRQVILTSDN